MRNIGVYIIVLLCLLTCYVAFAKKIPNPYKVLGISQNANDEEIKAAFKKRSRKYHPDRNKVDPRAKQKFQQVVNAYELLKDPKKRQIYDQTGGDGSDHFQGGQQHGGFGFPGGGFGFPGGGFGFPGGGFGGINIEDIMRAQMNAQAGQRQRSRGGQRRQQGRTYSFSFGGGQGSGFEF